MCGFVDPSPTDSIACRLKYNRPVSPLRKRLALVLAFALLVAAGAVIYLKLHAVEIINAVVLNAVIQRLPESYPPDTVREAFCDRLRSADTPEKRAHYLELLKEVSLRIEKVQHLESAEVDEILRRIRLSDSVLR